MLTDLGAWIGWLGVTAAAAAMMWLGLVERVLPMWIDIVSVLPVLAVLGMGLAVAGFPGIVGPLWLRLRGLPLSPHKNSPAMTVPGATSTSAPVVLAGPNAASV